MPKEQRVIVFVGTLVLLLIVYLALRNPIEAVGNKGIVILSCLIMLSFTVFLAEHFFTRPTDVIASSVSILLILAPMHESLKETGNWYWAFFGYNSVILIIALVSLFFLDRDKPEDAVSNRISAIAKVIAVRFGNGRFLWFAFFALCVLFYVDSQSSLFVILSAYAIILLLIDPKKAIIQISSLTTNTDTAVASLFGIQSQNVFLARIYPNGPSVSKLNIVGFASSIGGRKDWIAGLIIETYELNAQRWMKILVDDSFNEFKNKNIKPKILKRGVVHLLSLNEDLSIVKRLAGTVSAASTIDKLKFEYAFNASVEEGDLLEVCCGEIMVLYQVVEGVTGIESLESRDEAGVIIGEAIQLGSWNSENRSFDRYGWVPNINRPVFKARGG